LILYFTIPLILTSI